MSDATIAVIFVLIISFYAIWLHIYTYRKADKIIERWAGENGYRVIEKERKVGLNTGPYIYGGYATIHRVVIVDQDDKRSVVWTKTGKYFWPFSKSFRAHFEKLWNEEAT